MKSDIEIARENGIEDIIKVAEKLNLSADDLELYGKYKAKIASKVLDDKKSNDNNGKVILVTAINPTPAGEGKTTVTIGLGDALNKMGKKATVALRQPSLGPVFGIKGGATGGGHAQVIPMEDINLHFTGDFHAIEAANNLMCAALDNHIFQGNELDVDINKVMIKRAVDMNDRTLRNIVIGIGDKNGVERKDGYNITVASEVMAAFCLSSDIFELREKLGKIIVAYSNSGKPIFAKDLKVNGAMTALLKDAIKPNLVQTLEHNPAIIHGGPFANIAHGCNSLIATKLAMKLSDYVVTEAGFGSDLGAEKFIDIKCRMANIKPSAVVLVATIRALKYNGGAGKDNLKEENTDMLLAGICNLERHIENLKKFNVPVLVTLNNFDTDTEKEIQIVKERCENLNVPFSLSKAFAEGGSGNTELAMQVLEVIEKEETKEESEKELNFAYGIGEPIKDKIEKIAKEIYHAGSVTYSDKAEEAIDFIEKLNLEKMPICVAKTQMSFSDNAKLLGAPEGYEFKIKDVKVSNGAGFIVVYAGNILTMPGLGKEAAYQKIDIDDNGDIVGIY